MPPSWVPLAWRQAEPCLLVLLAGAAIGLRLVSGAGWLVPVVLAAAAALAATWAIRFPAHHQADLASRAGGLVATAVVLHLSLGAAEPEHLLWWTAGACAGYAFLLLPAWTAGVLLLAVQQLLAGSTGIGSTAWFGNLALLVLPAALAGVAGALLRRRGSRCTPEQLDAGTALFSRNGLAAFGDDLLDGCRRRGRPAAMVLFDCTDLAEVRAIYGSRTARALFRRLLARLHAVAGTRGIVARTGSAEFAVLLPGMDRKAAITAVRRVLGSPSRIEYDVGDSEIVLVPEFAVEEAGEEAADCRELYERLHARLSRLRQDQDRRQQRMRRSRERHTAPSEPPFATDAATDSMPLAVAA